MQFNGKSINPNSLEFNAHSGLWRGEKYYVREAYVSYAEYADGQPLNDNELEGFNETSEAVDCVNDFAQGF